MKQIDAVRDGSQVGERPPSQESGGGQLRIVERPGEATGEEKPDGRDADGVNEVPTELREQHDVLRDLAKRYGLQLTHIQSHYLPSGGEQCLSLLDVFGQLEIYLVDAYDVMISKLCSKRAKDLDDLRVMKPNIDRDTLHSRLSDAGHSLLAEERLREAAEKNWYILFGEPLA